MPVVDAPMFRTRKSPVIFVEIEPLLKPSRWLAVHSSNELEPSRHFTGYLVEVLGMPDRMGPPEEDWTYLALRVAPGEFRLLQYAVVGGPEPIPMDGDTPEQEARQRFILEWVEHEESRWDTAAYAQYMSAV
jgi:hypothetical protein